MCTDNEGISSAEHGRGSLFLFGEKNAGEIQEECKRNTGKMQEECEENTGRMQEECGKNTGKTQEKEEVFG